MAGTVYFTVHCVGLQFTRPTLPLIIIRSIAHEKVMKLPRHSWYLKILLLLYLHDCPEGGSGVKNVVLFLLIVHELSLFVILVYYQVIRWHLVYNSDFLKNC